MWLAVALDQLGHGHAAAEFLHQVVGIVLHADGVGIEGGRVHPGLAFLSRREVVDLVPVYAAADIFILPTIYDPFSNACLEALACGLPVITTRGNGFSEIIEHEVHGSIVDSGNDLKALRDAILFWSDTDRRNNARSKIIERASQFDISKNVAQTVAVLTQAAATSFG